MRRIIRVVSLISIALFLIGTAQAGFIQDSKETAAELTDLVLGDDSPDEEVKSHSSSTEGIPPEDFPVNPNTEASYSEDVWLTVLGDVQTRATVKLWGDVDNFKDYKCYAVVSDEKFYPDQDFASQENTSAILDPDSANASDDYDEGTDFNDDRNQKDTVIEIELNSLGEARLPAPESVSKEVEDSYFDTGLWGNSKLADKGTYLQTQCFKGNTATNMVFTEVGEKAYDTGKDEPEILDDLKSRYYTPGGKYSLGFETTGREDFKQKYSFSDITASSCSVNFPEGIEGQHSGKLTIENNNPYPVKVGANFKLDVEGGTASISGKSAWIDPDSQKEISFTNKNGIDDFPFSTSSSTEVRAKMNPKWIGSGGGSCEITCGTMGGSGNTEYPSSCTANSESTTQKDETSSTNWLNACPEELDTATLEGKRSCIINHISPSCVNSENPAAHCDQAVSNLCSYLGLKYDGENIRCEA